ncbi:MAG: ABC transporter permease [Treponema sp.]|jgi:ribose/xylose/arabinose/galactoside ABC-type transport system permease subunit|nr:ABC transporter permease [Treponema sp.]
MGGRDRPKVIGAGLSRRAWVEKGTLFVIIIVFVIIFSIASGGKYASPLNLMNILVAASLTGIVSIGMTFVILGAGIDLSVSGITVLTGISGAMMIDQGMNWLLACLFMLILGSLIGFINGFSITKLKMVPFVTTMAMMNITRGIARTMSNGKTINLPEAVTVFGHGRLFGLIPVPIIMLALSFLLGLVILIKTTFGREVYATGGNRRAAWLAGLKADRIIMLTYVVSGFFASLGAVLVISRLQSAAPTIGAGLELDSIAACVIGGTSLFGGEGGVGGTILGAILIAMINNGLNITGVTPFMQEIAKGLIIFVVIAIDAAKRSRKQE